jgi:glycosyltransferase involved in cell wall biosynthesis
MTTGSEPIRVLLFAFFFPPEMVTGALRPYRFYKYLPEFGVEPWVITGSEQNGGALEHVVQAPAPTRRPNKRTLLGATEKAMRLWVFPGDDAVMWPLSAVRTAKQLLKDVPIQAIISTFPPSNVHIAAARLQRQLKLPWIADFRDPLAGRPPTTGLPNRVSWFLERQFLNQAAAFIAVSDVVRDEWRARYPEHSHKFHLLWNGYDPEENIFALPMPPRQQHVMVHAGTLYLGRDPGLILRGLDRLLRAGSVARGSVAMRLLGEIDKQILAEQSDLFDRLRAADAISIPGMVSRDQALEELRTANSLVLLDMTHREGYTVPAKLYEYVRVGRPILALTDRGSPTQRILANSGIPHTIITKDDPDERVDAALLDFLSLPSEPRKPSEWFVENFDGRRQAASMAQLLRTVIQSEGKHALRHGRASI